MAMRTDDRGGGVIQYASGEDSMERNVKVDVIIWGTEYFFQKWRGSYKVIGESGKTFEAKNYFPNFLMLWVPNNVTWWLAFIDLHDITPPTHMKS